MFNAVMNNLAPVFARLRALLLAVALAIAAGVRADSPWPAITREMKPWTYWWWPGSAVDATNLTRQLEQFAAAGYGGVHVIPIYGPKNSPHPDINYLSDEWLAMLRHTIKEGERLDLGVDMTLGTGWCFGGPNITTNLSGMMLDPKTLKPKPTGIKVKRAAPGGEGFMLNPIYGDAMSHYLERFTEAFAGTGGANRPGEPGVPAERLALPRAVYHDSYEYAKASFSPDFFAEFKKRRGYDLEPELKNLFSNADSNRAAKVRCDYNETVSDLMVENSMPKWIEWAHARGMRTRYQAHGSPANWLDLYALADIPETEMFHTDRDILISKFASSAAHITGKNLVAAETGTWLEEHFTETLADMKKLVDQLFLSGVNHVVYHGNCYSPDDAPWPGWLFYASTEMNSRNAIWRDLPALNAYIARCQSRLQAGEPDNDILLYWPIHDYWSHTKSLAPMMTVHNREWFYDEEIGKTAKWLWENGYSFDYVSDRQLTNAVVRDGRIQMPGASYRALVLPNNSHTPSSTLVLIDRIRAKGGITVRTVELEQNKIYADPIKKEGGLNYIRRRLNGRLLYFVVNESDKPFDGWLPHQLTESPEFINPLTDAGLSSSNSERFISWCCGKPSPGTANRQVQLHMEPHASLFLWDSESYVHDSRFPPSAKTSKAFPIAGLPWSVEFIAGGPELPAAYTTDKLASWTECSRRSASGGNPYEAFAGTARYTLKFDAPERSGGIPAPDSSSKTGTGMSPLRWQLDLGEVHESARVKVNGKDFGTLIMPPYRVVVDNLKPKDNVLEVEVTNLSANRIRDLDRRKVDWKVMKDINLVNIDYKPFDASNWPVRPSGLLGPVTLAPVAGD